MSSTPKSWPLVAVALAAALAIVLWMERKPLQIAHHVSGLRGALTYVPKPDSIEGYFTKQGLQWLRHGTRSNKEREESADFHREALVRLGYFERREFRVDCELVGERLKEFTRMRYRYRQYLGPFWKTRVDPAPGKTMITVCGRASEMNGWEKLCADFDESSRKIK